MAIKSQAKEKIAKANRILGIIFRVKSDFNESLRHLIEAEKIYTLLGDSLALAQNNIQIGTHYKLVREFDKAKFFYDKARYTLEDHSELFPQNTELYKSYIELNRNEADLATNRNRPDEAEMFIRKNMELDEKLGKKGNTGQYLMSLAVIYEKRGDLKKAYEYYKNALQEKLNSGDKNALTLYYVYLGSAASKLEKFEEAEINLKKGLENAEKSQAVSMVGFAHTKLSENYERKKDFEKALKHMKIAEKIEDSVFNAESANNLAKMQSKFELDRKQAEIDLLEKDKKIKNLMLLAFGAAALFFTVLFALTIVFVYKNARKNHLLQEQNDLITQKNAMLEQQQEEIRAQNESVRQLNEQLNARTDILEEKNKEIASAFQFLEDKNRQIINSIRYAEQIQAAALPFRERIKKSLPESFIFYRPKDIVSGDFYWFAAKKDKIYVAAADCTGHGVPGAFMSLIGMNFLSYLVNERGIEDPNLILEGLDLSVKTALRQEEQQNSDGIAIGIVCYDRAQLRMYYAGANNTMFYAVDNELYAIKGEKYSVGGYRKARPGSKKFVLQEVPIKKNTTIYLCSDGYQDQIGGGAHKRFTSTNLKMLLLDASQMKISEQADFLEKTFVAWQGDEPQTDDVLVFGFKV
jgi:serine phosphatase RsbU (regulator of sigma subunit)